MRVYNFCMMNYFLVMVGFNGMLDVSKWFIYIPV